MTCHYILDSYNLSWHLEILTLLTTSEIIKDTPEKNTPFASISFRGKKKALKNYTPKNYVKKLTFKSQVLKTWEVVVKPCDFN